MANSLEKAREIINRVDREMAALFVERMGASEAIAEYKRDHGLEVLDPAREAEVIRRNSELVDDPVMREYYVSFLKSTMAVSRSYQTRLIKEARGSRDGYRELDITELTVELGERSYPIHIGKGLISRASEHFNLNRRVLVLTDAGVPAEYAQAIAAQVTGEVRVYTVPVGEGSKSLGTLEGLLSAMAEMKMGRRDCVIAVGGGVVGDLAGFAAAVYMRGIEFYNIPTTLLAMVDSSIGGKTAVNLGGIKNIVGAFHQPSGVIIDPDVLLTLDSRLRAAGLCEAIKMAATSDEGLFEYFEKKSSDEVYAEIEWVITRALKIKKAVVERDEREEGLRRVLNFGHTLGHGIEAERGGSLYHGECVALGMLPMCEDEVRVRLCAVLEKHGLPTEYTGDVEAALGYAAHDKKADGGLIDAVVVEKIGTHRIEPLSAAALAERVGRVFA